MTITADSILKSTDLPEKTRNEIPRVMNRLVGQTFLYQEDDSDKDDYYLAYRHRAVQTGGPGGIQGRKRSRRRRGHTDCSTVYITAVDVRRIDVRSP